MSQTTALPPGTESSASGPDLSYQESEAKPSRRLWPWILLLFLIGIGVGGWYYWSKRAAASAPQFQTTPVARGDIVQEVTANGSLNPVKQVEVGSQVSGIIEKILVDFNSKVKENELLAQIDPSTYQKALAQAKAQLSSAKAALELADVNYRRAEELFKNKLISGADHDAAVAAFHQAQATVEIQEALMEGANVNLGYTQIKAPISGVVISREVDEGQTVASSFNTPKLFVIANDLTKMQIEAAVSEADVGGVEEGERVSFGVDAFPNRKFFGQVKQVRFAPITNQNVITYTTVVNVDNPDLKLRPGMTATAKLIIAEKKNVLRVLSAALRFRPPPNTDVKPRVVPGGAEGSTNAAPTVQTDSAGVPIAPWRAEGRRPNPGEREKWEATLTPDQRAKVQQMMQQMMQRRAAGGEGGGGPGGPGPTAAPRVEGPTIVTAYLLKASDPANPKEKPVLESVTVKAGVTDGLYTEILDGLKEGDQVVTRMTTGTTAAAGAPTQNPFSPFGGRPQQPARK